LKPDSKLLNRLQAWLLTSAERNGMRTALTSALIAAGLAWAHAPALAADKTNPDWPCVQKKIESLSAGQTWDGPPVETEKVPWADDEKIKDLIQFLTSRRVGLPEAETAVKKFADAQPAAERDAKLTLLFAGLFETSNSQRKTVLGGLEKYLKAQRDRAKIVEQKGAELDQLREKTGLDEAGEMALAKAQEAFDWETRIFQERQQNIPVACEIPVIIEQRLYDLVKTIRGLMSK
jgi:hypothetical protein